MDPWTLFWIVVLLIIVWTFRYFIAVGILTAIAFVCGLLGLATFSAFEVYGRFDDWKDRRKRKRRSGGI